MRPRAPELARAISNRGRLHSDRVEHDLVIDPVITMAQAVSKCDGLGEFWNPIAQGRRVVKRTAARFTHDLDLPLHG
jgi:hypothetical protein